MSQHIGIFSGTFDPIHLGHIAFAKEALRVCHLDKIVFLPEISPREKQNVTDISHRVELLKLATKNEKDFTVLQTSSKQFSVKDTLPELHRIFKDSSFTLLIGSDIVKTFLYRWTDLDLFLSEVSLAIGMRANDTPDEISTILHGLERDHNLKINYTFINTSNMNLASSQVRNDTTNESILDQQVVDYINVHSLYR